MSGSGVVGVVVTYWPKRRHLLPRIVEGFMEQTVPVDELIIWNNHPDPIEPVTGATVINSGGNYTSRAKYAAAIVRPSPYYLLVDDDIAPRHLMCEHFMKWAEPGCCLSLQGLQMVDRRLSAGTEVNGLFIDEPVPVDSFIGVSQFMSLGAIATMLLAEEKVRVDDGYFMYDGEDILIAMANDSARVIPVFDAEGNDCGYWPLHEAQAEAMQQRPGYYVLRDTFAWKAWQLLGKPDLSGVAPGLTAADHEMMKAYRRAEGT